jgi:glycosyltransferase involved in cell wall biosynthesis
VKTALMITYYFPPLGGIGVQRSAKFVKYLPREGWKPVVLTVRPNWRNTLEQGIDHTLGDIPEQVEVIRARSAEFAGMYALLRRLGLKRTLIALEQSIPFLSHDYKIGWYPFAVRAARRRLRRSPVDVVYTSSTPYLAHFIGKALSREYGIPWVADFRDPWTQRTYYRSAAPFQDSLDRRLEANVMESADAVIANTPINKRAICRDFHVPADRVHVIPNGYDPEDFECPEANGPDDERFVITCIGNFYEMPDPEAFFRAYRRLHQEHPAAYLRFFGSRLRNVRKAARILEIGSWEASERITHAEAISAMRGSAVLLANLPRMTDTHWVPGKLYEYLAAGRPILFIGPRMGEAATIVQRAHAGLTAENDEAAILEALRKLYADWNARHPLRPNLDVVHEYDRRRQTRRLAALFEQVERSRHTTGSIDRRRELLVAGPTPSRRDVSCLPVARDVATESSSD